MGAVYRGEGPGGAAAIKVIRGDSLDADARLRFQREAEASARVDRHPNVASVLAADLMDKPPWIAFELAEGGTLETRLKSGALAPRALDRLAGELASGLRHLHEHGGIHRDLKPANVLFRADAETALIADFGLARLENGDSLTQSGAMLGTPATMAPEQIEGLRPTPACDVWAFGVVLYEAATGRRPFRAASTQALLMAILGEDPTPPQELRPELDPALAGLIERCLAKDPAARPADGGELIALLESGSTGPSRPSPRRRRRVVILVLLLLLVSLGALGFEAGRAVFAARRRRSEADLTALAAASELQRLMPGVDRHLGLRLLRHLATFEEEIAAHNAAAARAFRESREALRSVHGVLAPEDAARLDDRLEACRLRSRALELLDQPERMIAQLEARHRVTLARLEPELPGVPPEERPLVAIYAVLARSSAERFDPAGRDDHLPGDFPIPEVLRDPLDRRALAVRVLAAILDGSPESLTAARERIESHLRRGTGADARRQALRAAVLQALQGLEPSRRADVAKVWLSRPAELAGVLPILPLELQPDPLSAALLRERLTQLEQARSRGPILTAEAARAHIPWLKTALRLGLHDPSFRLQEPVSRVLIATFAARVYEDSVKRRPGGTTLTESVYLRIGGARLGLVIDIPKKEQLLRWIGTARFEDLDSRRWRAFLTAVAEQTKDRQAAARRLVRRFQAAREVLRDESMPLMARAECVTVLGEMAGEDREWGKRGRREPGDPKFADLSSRLSAEELEACLARVDLVDARQHPRPDMLPHAIFKGFGGRLSPERCQQLLVRTLELHERRARAGEIDERGRPLHVLERQRYDPYDKDSATTSVKASYIVDQAETALRADDRSAARRFVLAALEVQPRRDEALKLLYHIEKSAGRGAEVLARIERLIPRSNAEQLKELRRLRTRLRRDLGMSADPR